MNWSLAGLAIVVPDYDEAIDYYVGTLGFELLEDTPRSETKRWVRVAPARDRGPWLLLAKGVGERQVAAIGNQTGGRVFLFLNTTDFEADYRRLSERGVRFVRLPKDEPYGRVAVFEDRFGNLWDLIEPAG